MKKYLILLLLLPLFAYPQRRTLPSGNGIGNDVPGYGQRANHSRIYTTPSSGVTTITPLSDNATWNQDTLTVTASKAGATATDNQSWTHTTVLGTAVFVVVDSNFSVSRVGTVTIAGLTFCVYQSAFDANYDGNTSVWYDMVDSTNLTKDVNNQITELSDLSGNGYDLTPNEAGHALWSSSGVTFDHPLAKYTGNIAFSQAVPLTVYMAVKQTVWASLGVLLSGGTWGSTFHLIQHGASPTLKFYTSAGISETALAVGELGVLTLTATTNAGSIQKNNDTPVTGSITGNAFSKLLIGENQYGTACAFQMKVLIIRNGVDDSPTQYRIKKFIYTTYGITP